MLKQLWWQHKAFLLSSCPPSRTSMSVVGLSCTHGFASRSQDSWGIARRVALQEKPPGLFHHGLACRSWPAWAAWAWPSIILLLSTQSRARVSDTVICFIRLNWTHLICHPRPKCCWINDKYCLYVPVLPYAAVPSWLERLLVTVQRCKSQLSCDSSCHIPSALSSWQFHPVLQLAGTP